MGAYVLLVFVALACTAQGGLLPRIIGGIDALDGKYPYQVSVKFYGKHMCGGSIIDEYNILTAAHCLAGTKNELDYLKVHAGTNFQNETGEVYSTASISIHQDYASLNRFFCDIGLIHLATPIKFNTKVQPIKLATTDINNGTCKLIGWGYTNVRGSRPNNLQEIDLQIYPYEKCKAKDSEVQKNNICTLTKRGEGACFGDSGGPLIVDDVQIGIVSFGRPCALGHPDIFTKIYSFRDWIDGSKKNITEAKGLLFDGIYNKNDVKGFH